MQSSLYELANLVGGELVNITTSQAKALGVKGCTARSTEAGSSSLFVAIRGSRVDGHRFVDDAKARGAVAAVVEDAQSLGMMPGVVVAKSQIALSRLGAHLAGYPANKLYIVGITGTNGKTTTTSLTAELLGARGGASASLGTLGLRVRGESLVVTEHTTPDAIALQELLQIAAAKGANGVAMEVSSHALHQHRADDIAFDCGVFTNLTRDHLDYHGSFSEYLAAKLRLVELVAQSSKSKKGFVINTDDEYGEVFLQKAESCSLPVLTYGRSATASLRLQEGLPVGDGGSIVRFHYEGKQFEAHSPLLGEYNAANLLAAFGVGIQAGLTLDELIAAAPNLSQVPGRLEQISRGGVTAVVDYAHTPDALQRVLATLREVKQGALWVVFGCGGDRDRGKRPQMGAIACELADEVVVTSDNPRSEPPDGIIHDILAGTRSSSRAIVDRREAIEFAINNAAPGDLVLVAGKGHEDYQILGSVTVPFSDLKIASNALHRRFS